LRHATAVGLARCVGEQVRRYERDGDRAGRRNSFG